MKIFFSMRPLNFFSLGRPFQIFFYFIWFFFFFCDSALGIQRKNFMAHWALRKMFSMATLFSREKGLRFLFPDFLQIPPWSSMVVPNALELKVYQFSFSALGNPQYSSCTFNPIKHWVPSVSKSYHKKHFSVSKSNAFLTLYKTPLHICNIREQVQSLFRPLRLLFLLQPDPSSSFQS